MTATDATRRDPLAPHAARLAAASDAGVRLAGVPFLAQTGLRVRPGSDAARAAEAVLGAPLPDATRVATAGERHVLWQGPDEWLITGPPGSDDGLVAALAEAVGGEGAAVDVGCNRVALEVAGPDSRDVLATCCSLDLHPSAFGPGRCAGTLLASAQVVLEQTTDEPCFRIHVRPSFLGYAVEWLVAGAEAVRAARM